MKPFQLSIVHHGNHIKGEVIPMNDQDVQGIPLSFEVKIEGKNYGMFRCNKDKWLSTDIKDESLVDAIGNYIHAWYE
jgi:hypothetical protein